MEFRKLQPTLSPSHSLVASTFTRPSFFMFFLSNHSSDQFAIRLSANSSTHSSTHSSIHSQIYSLTYPLTNPFTHLPTHSSIHSLTYPLTHKSTQSLSTRSPDDPVQVAWKEWIYTSVKRFPAECLHHNASDVFNIFLFLLIQQMFNNKRNI